jgi:hypothetical protein
MCALPPAAGLGRATHSCDRESDEEFARGHVPELFEFSTRSGALLRVRDLAVDAGQRLLVLRGMDGAQRVVTSRCDCDASGLPGTVTILPDDPAGKAVRLTRAALLTRARKK